MWQSESQAERLTTVGAKPGGWLWPMQLWETKAPRSRARPWQLSSMPIRWNGTRILLCQDLPANHSGQSGHSPQRGWLLGEEGRMEWGRGEKGNKIIAIIKHERPYMATENDVVQIKVWINPTS